MSTTKKPKKLNRTSIKRRLGPLVKAYVKKRDNFTCLHCGKVCEGSDCHGSHILSVGAHSHMEFEPRNIKVLCFRCHIYWWHKDVAVAGEWYKDNYPENWAWLKEQDIKRTKLSTFELNELLDKYKKNKV